MPTPEDAVQTESIRAIYRQLPLTLSVSALNAVVTSIILAPYAGLATIAAWLLLFVLMIGLRAAAWRTLRRLPQDVPLRPTWAHIGFFGSLASGLLWGVSVPWLMPPQEPYPLFMAFVIGGMCAGSVTVNAAHPPSVVAFILPSVLPLVLWFALSGAALGWAMAFMTAVFIIALILASLRYAKEFGAGVRARLALDERTRELATTNERLRSEVADREHAEAALRQSQKMEALGSLTAGVAHDVNNVLMVVRGATEVLKRRLAQAPGHQRQIGAILRATERGAALTGRLLAFARKDALKPEVIDVNAALRGTAALLSATLGKSVQVILALHEALPPVFVDRSGFDQAILNLAINARDAMPDGGTLTIRTDLAPSQGPTAATASSSVTVAVGDTGSGMTQSVLARAFDPFFTTKPVGQGSGLGLSQVYGFARQSGGTSHIESRPGSGTVVTLFLPPAAAQAPAPATEPPFAAANWPDDATQPPHVVLLDDEDLVREVIAELLESAGYHVSAFARAADALRCVALDRSVVLLVTDLGMPEMSGEEVALQARQARPDLPVLFITGFNDPEQQVDERWLLRKPFTETDLLALVAQALRHPAGIPEIP